MRNLTARRVKRGVFATVAVCVLAHRQHAQESPRATAVYQAVIDSALRTGARKAIVVRDSSLRFNLPGGNVVPEWSARFAAIPPSLPPRLATASRTRVPSERLALPMPVVVMTRVVQDSLFRADPGASWLAFFHRFPDAPGYFGFSPVVFSDDGSQALLYYEFHCGGLCGWGDAVLVTLDARGVSRITHTVRFWVF
jgi:hypothetical protein